MSIDKYQDFQSDYKIRNNRFQLKTIEYKFKHSMYLSPTTQLYEPLRQTLDKSMVRNPALELQKSRVYEQMGSTSRISRRMRSLSPEQASYIKSSTIIPVDRDLVPTDHLWKVRGKEFTAVNIQVREGVPVPASAMRIPAHLQGGRITTETVYELRPRQSQARNLSNTRSITNLRTVYPPRPQTISTNQVSQVLVRPPTSSVRRTASPIRVSQAPTIPSSLPIPIDEYQIQPIQPIQSVSSASRQNIAAHKYNQQYSKPVMDNRPSTNYEMDSNFNGNGNGNGNGNKKQSYKYNFFSALDEAVNTKCGSCGANQIIASKPFSSWD